MQFAEAVHRHRGIPEVARFGLSCGLLNEDDDVVHPGAAAVVAAGAASGASATLTGFSKTTRSVGTSDDRPPVSGSGYGGGYGGGGGGGVAAPTLRGMLPADMDRVLLRGRTQRTTTVDEMITNHNVADDGFLRESGYFSTGLQLAPGDSNLLGVDTRYLNHALALDLAELQSKVMPTDVKHELLIHPLAEEAAEALGSAVGMDSILGYVADRSFADAMAGVDLGIAVSEEQLPQLHVLLIEACDILRMPCPLLYVKHHPMPAVYPWGVRGFHPSLVVTSAAIEVMAPRELQAAMAGAVAHLLPGSAPVEVTAHSVMCLAPELFLTREGVRPVWPSVIRPALDRWGRFAELSADRAALVVAQDVDVVVSAIMKMAAGSPTLNGQLNVHALLDRAREIDQEQMAHLPQLLRQADPGHLVAAGSSLAVLRAREVMRFHQSEGYTRMMASGAPASRPNTTFQRQQDLLSLAYMDVLPSLPSGVNLLSAGGLESALSMSATAKKLESAVTTPPQTYTSAVMAPRPPNSGGPSAAVSAGGPAPRSSRIASTDGGRAGGGGQ